MKNGDKNNSVEFIILFRIYIYIYIYISLLMLLGSIFILCSCKDDRICTRNCCPEGKRECFRLSSRCRS